MGRSTEPPAIVIPFTIIRDFREARCGWLFDSVQLVRRGKLRPVQVTVNTRHMKTGDYTVEEIKQLVVIERKTIEDLAGTMTRGRRRFVAELERMREFTFSAVVVEGSWIDLVRFVREQTEATPQSVQASLNAFIVRYPTQWLFRCGRREAETTALQLMVRAVKDKEDGKI